MSFDAAAPFNPIYYLFAHGDSLTHDSGLNAFHKIIASTLTISGTNAISFDYGTDGIGWDYDNGGGSNTLINQATNMLYHVPAQLGNATVKLVCWAGTNNIWNQAHSAAQTYSAFETYIANVLANGWDASNIVVCTMIPRDTVPANEASRITYNDLLVTGAGTYGYTICRLDQDANIGLPGCQTNGTYWGADQLHLKQAGQNIVANLVAIALGLTGDQVPPY